MPTPNSFHIQVHVKATPPRPPKVFHFRREAIHIGRSPDNDLVLPDASVGEQVGELHLIGGVPDRFLLHSGDRLHEYADGDTMTVGRYGLTFIVGAPPSEREQTFLQQLEADPSDDQLRIVYSDWLEENDREAAAEFIRAQVRLPTLDPDSAAFTAAKQTLETLGRLFPAHWRRTIARPPIENCDVRFELQCPKQWGQLAPTADPNQRFCETCARNVHYAPTVGDARRLAIAGECVVVDLTQLRRPRDLEEDEERYMLAGMISP